MSDDLTHQDAVNHVTQGTQQLDKRIGGIADRMETLENRVENLVWRLQRELVDFREEVARRFDSLQEDLHASMEDIGVIKDEQKAQDRRIDQLSKHAGLAA